MSKSHFKYYDGYQSTGLNSPLMSPDLKPENDSEAELSFAIFKDSAVVEDEFITLEVAKDDISQEMKLPRNDDSSVLYRAHPNDQLTQILSQEFLFYAEYYKNHDCIPESKAWFSPDTQESLWNGHATGVGTAAWMGIYYLKDFFNFKKKFIGYSLNSLLMGIVSNLAALPFVYKGQRALGESKKDTFHTMWIYFWLCLFPDSLYEPTADFFIAFCKSPNFKEFEFVPYADPEFTASEIGASFVFFGLLFGLVFYLMKTKLFKTELTPEENHIEANTAFLKFLKCIKPLFKEGNVSEALKIIFQYNIFYGTDYFFDTDLGQGNNLIWNLFAVCEAMVWSSVLLDKLFDGVASCITRLENHIYDHQLVPISNDDEEVKYIYRKDCIPLDDDYVYVAFDEDETELNEVESPTKSNDSEYSAIDSVSSSDFNVAPANYNVRLFDATNLQNTHSEPAIKQTATKKM